MISRIVATGPSYPKDAKDPNFMTGLCATCPFQPRMCWLCKNFQLPHRCKYQEGPKERSRESSLLCAWRHERIVWCWTTLSNWGQRLRHLLGSLALAGLQRTDHGGSAGPAHTEVFLGEAEGLAAPAELMAEGECRTIHRGHTLSPAPG